MSVVGSAVGGMLRGSSMQRMVDNNTVATVFGGTGFLGRFAVNRFARTGAHIVLPFRGEEKGYDHIKPMGKQLGQIVPRRFSIREPESVYKAVEKSSIVVNLLGKHYHTRNFTMEEANIHSARTIATAAKRAGVERFIHLSVVGADPASSCEWKRTKAESERVVKEIFPEATILRCTTMFGVGDRFLTKYGRLASIFGNVPLPLHPQTKIQPVFVGNVASATLAAVEKNISKGKTYELAGSEVVTLEELINHYVLPLMEHKSAALFPIKNARLAHWMAKLMEFGRDPYFTVDELKFFEVDNTITNPKDVLTLEDLDIPPEPLYEIAKQAMRQFKRI